MKKNVQTSPSKAFSGVKLLYIAASLVAALVFFFPGRLLWQGIQQNTTYFPSL
jgi:hypothetical protein